MSELSRTEILDALKEFQAAASSKERREPQVSEKTKDALRKIVNEAAYNEGTSRFPQIARAYQASFETLQTTSGVDAERLQLVPSELTSYVRLDLGDGEEPIAPAQGLLAGIVKVAPALLDKLDLAAIKDAAKISVATGTKTRVSLQASGSTEAISKAIKAYPQAGLVGKITLGFRPPTPDAVVKLAAALTEGGATFALANVMNAKQLEETVLNLHLEDLYPATADLDFGIGRDLGTPGDAGSAAFETTKSILDVAARHDITVTITAVAVGSPQSRKALFDAAEQVGFHLENIRMSGRDLMPETVGIARGLPEPVVERATGNVLSL